MLKDYLDSLLPSILHIINTSLEMGIYPSTFNKSLLRPSIKKNPLDQDVFPNYRPISNLSFLSKTLERLAAKQMDSYLSMNGRYAQMQSAYRKHHSTETALVRVFNDITLTIDNHRESILILLDLSSAFDTIDHNILLHRLHKRFRFSNRPQSVYIEGIMSSPRHYLSCGVPQGSVLGSMLFSMYVAPLEDVINSHGLNAMMFEDDSQIYIFMEERDRQIAIGKMCVKDVMDWNKRNNML